MPSAFSPVAPELRRHPNVPTRRIGLTPELRDRQIKRGIYTLHHGAKLAIPVDDLSDSTRFLGRDFWRRDALRGTHRAGAVFAPPEVGDWRRRLLHWANKNVDPDYSASYYKETLGHDLHTSVYGDLFARHWHPGWADPFEPENVSPALDPLAETLNSELQRHIAGLYLPRPSDKKFSRYERIAAFREAWLKSRGPVIVDYGFVEELGWLSGAKVTDAFVSEIIDELVSATGSEFADFDFHEVGTDSTAEANSQTALIVSSGIARATGTPTDSDPIYQSVATITADATETWEEHGLFNNSTGAALMDRSLTGGQSVASGNQVSYTYQLTVNEEA